MCRFCCLTLTTYTILVTFLDITASYQVWCEFGALVQPAEILYLISRLAFVDIIPDKFQNYAYMP